LYTKGVYTVSAKVMPSEVKGEVLTWTSSNSGIATIDNQGNITPLKSGKVTITVTASNGKSASQDFMVREVLGEVTIYIGDVIGWPGKDYASYDFSIVEGNEETVDLSSPKVIMGRKVGSVVISSYDSEYLRVRVNKQDKLTMNQVIALTGYPPTSVNGKELDYTLFTTGGGREYLRTHFRNYVLPKLDGMSLDITLPSWEFSEGEERLFEEWLLMMYGGLKPTPEEMMALLAHYIEPLPIIGTAVTIQKTIVSYQNGKTMEALIRSGVVAFRVVGDVLLVKEIWKTAVEFSFTDDAMEILTTSAVGQMDDAVRVGLISQLDELERFAAEGGLDIMPQIANRGSTGRIIANDLNEQLAMQQVKSNPLFRATEILIPMNDSRWLGTDGWVKMQNIVKLSDGTQINIYFVYNKVLNLVDDIKFK